MMDLRSGLNFLELRPCVYVCLTCLLVLEILWW
jgi:hypothetical protein